MFPAIIDDRGRSKQIFHQKESLKNVNSKLTSLGKWVKQRKQKGT